MTLLSGGCWLQTSDLDSSSGESTGRNPMRLLTAQILGDLWSSSSRLTRSDGGAKRPCRRWLVLSRARTRSTRAGRHRRPRHLEWRSCSPSPPRHDAAGRSSDRYPKGWKDCCIQRQPSRARFSKSRFPSRAVYGPIDHAGLRLTCGGTYDAAGHSYLDNVVVFARRKAVPGPGWLTTRRGQLITTTKGLDVRPEPGSSTRSR
jgi:hypothetical protein